MVDFKHKPEASKFTLGGCFKWMSVPFYGEWQS